VKKEKVKYIYRCTNCLGKLCSVYVITEVTMAETCRPIKCREPKPGRKASWVCIAAVKPHKEDLE
jgi:hypothetical protein